MEIRQMGEEDIPAVGQIEKACFTVPWSEESFRVPVTGRPYRCRVCIEDGRIVGYCCCMYIYDECELMNIAVMPEYRRRGIASELLKDMMAYEDRHPIERYMLEVREGNTAARRLYESFGFEVTGRRKGYYTKPDEDAILMDRYKTEA